MTKERTMADIHENEEMLKLTPIRTWADIWQSCRDSRWLLWLLEWVSHTDSELRLFACWCARQAWLISGLVIYEGMVKLVELHAVGKANREEINSLREKCRGGAAGAGVCGMPRCIPSAAVQLASWHTSADEAKHAAWWSAHYAARAAGFTAAREEADRIHWERSCEDKWPESYRIKYFIDKNPQVANKAEGVARAKQADALRGIIGNPMFRDTGDMPFPAQTLAYWMSWGFLPERGMQDEWQFSSDILGVKVNLSTLVEKFSRSGVVVCTTDTTQEVFNRELH